MYRFAALGLVLLPTSVASAEVLVTVDGGRIETRGPYEVRGRRILYTDQAGQLVSIRASLVDVEASERANQPPPPPTPSADLEEARRKAREEAKKAAVVIKQEDVGMADMASLGRLVSANLVLSQLSQAEQLEVFTPLTSFSLKLMQGYERDGQITAQLASSLTPSLHSLGAEYQRRAQREQRPHVAEAMATLGLGLEAIATSCDNNSGQCVNLLGEIARQAEASMRR